MNTTIPPAKPSANAAESPAVDHACYLRNVAMLWRYDAELAVSIDAIADEARLVPERTRSDAWSVALPTSDGRSVQLHSRYDPRAEADKLVDGVDVDDCYCFLVHGLGLGYHVAALREKVAPDAIIVVVEPNLALIATALAHVDLTDALDRGRLIFITSEEKSALHARLQPHTALVMLGARFVVHPASQRIANDFHTRVRALLTEFVGFSRTSMITLVNNAQITCRNIMQNIGVYASTTSVAPLEKRYAGMPAVIVSAGPSLRRNVDQLIEARDRVVVCSVQTTLKTLMDRGIVPDFVTSLDYHEVSKQYFDGVEGLENVHLVAEPKATWHVLDHYPGPISILDNPFARLLIGDHLAPRAALPAGATVAHLAFYLANYMGCDPIIFIGQDLAYSGYVYYAPGMEIHRSWRGEINRFNTMETKEWERTARMGKMLRKTVDAEGKKIYTDDLLFTYLEQFERDIAQSPARVINATEGGARIRGAEHMPLADALAQYAKQPIPADRKDYLHQTQWRNPNILPKVREEVAIRLDEVKNLRDVCDAMHKVLKELEGLTDQPDRFNRKIARVDELRAQVNRAQRAYRIINATSQLSELRRFSADRKLSTGKLEGVERAKQQLQRDLEFVGGVRDAGETVQTMLEETLERLEQSIAESKA